jgi:hypothetical protein
MSINTTNLGLIKPQLTDEIHQTIADVATSFQKIDDAAELYKDAIPTTGIWNKKQRVWNGDPAIGEYVGWVVVRTGQAADKWSSLYPYTIGDLATPLLDNGHVYKCIQGGTSAVSAPTFPVVTGAIVEDRQGSSGWQAATDYVVNSIVTPSVPNGCFYVCESVGDSGSSEPLWAATEGDVTIDSGLTWRAYRIVKWEEVGTSALFKGFGKIE